MKQSVLFQPAAPAPAGKPTPSVYPVSLAELDHALRVDNLSAQLGLLYMTRADKLVQQAKLRQA